MKHYILSLSIVLLLISCAPTVKTNITNQEQALSNNDKVAFLDVNHKVPENAIKIGNTKFGDSGFSINCSFTSNLIKARQIALKYGANIVKITQRKQPDFVSSCYRMKIDFYKYDGDLKSLEQYHFTK